MYLAIRKPRQRWNRSPGLKHHGQSRDDLQNSLSAYRLVVCATAFQVTTDGLAPYRSAIVTTLQDRPTGFAQLIKGLSFAT